MENEEKIYVMISILFDDLDYQVMINVPETNPEEFKVFNEDLVNNIKRGWKMAIPSNDGGICHVDFSKTKLVKITTQSTPQETW